MGIPKVSHLLRFLAVLSIVLLAFGCTGARRDTVLRPAPDANELPELLAPLDALATSRGASALQLERTGADFDPALPNNRVVVQGDDGKFDAVNEYSDPSQIMAQTAYAIYRFTLDDSVSRVLQAQFDGGAGGPGVSSFFGVANFARNQWEWEWEGVVNVGDRVAPDGSVLIAVVLINYTDQEFWLKRLSFHAYDEVEDNDSPAQANVLPSQNVTDFVGSLGDPVGGSQAYDGDLEDWFEIPGTFAEGQSLALTVNELSGGNLLFELYNSLGDLIEESEGYPFIELQWYGEDTELPLRIKVFTSTGPSGSDYSLRVQSGFEPVAKVVADIKFGDAPQTVTFDASGSTDLDNDIVEYAWTFDPSEIYDDFITTEPTVQHTFTEDGVYEISVRVTDSAGFNGYADEVVFLGPNPYTEIENNDDEFTAQEVGMSGEILGNLSKPDKDLMPDYLAYDGDTADYIKIPVVPDGISVRAVVERTTGAGVFGISIFGEGWDQPAFLDPGAQLQNYSGADIWMTIQVEGEYAEAWGDYTLRWYSGIEPNTPSITMVNGPEPRTVHYTAIASDPDGSIVLYEWDLDGDLNYETNAVGADVQFTYPVGQDTARVHLIVYDDDNLRAEAEEVAEGY